MNDRASSAREESFVGGGCGGDGGCQDRVGSVLRESRKSGEVFEGVQKEWGGGVENTSPSSNYMVLATNIRF